MCESLVRRSCFAPFVNFVDRVSGEYGLGTMANELALGCDCLGQIHYLVCYSSLWIMVSNQTTARGIRQQ
jgi:hypothetical protein